MKKINLQKCDCSIFIKRNIFSTITYEIEKLGYKNNFFILTQEKIYDLYSENEIFKSDNKIILKDSEKVKTLSVAEDIVNKLVEKGCKRDSLIVGIGGGVITDIAGFIASIFMRGVTHVFIPTTLLAMVDASIGGKTAINTKQGKNLIGTFKHPYAIYIDSFFLLTLDLRQLINGFAEIIKYGLICDKDFFNYVKNNFEKLINLEDIETIDKVIEQCCRHKKTFILDDEYDYNERMKLNFGHTIGHAIETYFNYKNILHGEAVYYGMLASNYISYHLKYISKVEFMEITKFIKSIPKFQLENIDFEKLYHYIQFDKKQIGNKKNFILLDKIGDARIETNVSPSIIKESLQFILK